MTISWRHVFLERFEKDYPYLANSVGEGAYGIAYFGGVRGKGVGTGIRLARLKFELTNQDSVGGKNFTVLTLMYVNRKGIVIGQLFSLEIALNIH